MKPRSVSKICVMFVVDHNDTFHYSEYLIIFISSQARGWEYGPHFFVFLCDHWKKRSWAKYFINNHFNYHYQALKRVLLLIFFQEPRQKDVDLLRISLWKLENPFQMLLDNHCQDFHPPVIKSSCEFFRLVGFICCCLSDRFAWHNFEQISTKPGYLICWWHARGSHHFLLFHLRVFYILGTWQMLLCSSACDE